MLLRNALHLGGALYSEIVKEFWYRTFRYLDTTEQASGAYPHLTFIGVQECDRACALQSRYACAYRDSNVLLLLIRKLIYK